MEAFRNREGRFYLIIREAFAMYGIGKAPDTTAPKFAGEA